MAPHPYGRPLTLIGLLATLVTVPAPAHADPVGTFYARMLEEHGGVFVDEELAGVLDRREVADDLRAALDGHGVRLSLLVVEGVEDRGSLDRLARISTEEGTDPVLVLSPGTVMIGRANLDGSGVPEAAVDHAAYTGVSPEYPADTLDHVLSAAEHPDVEEMALLAEAEFHAASDGHGEGTEADTASRAAWPGAAGVLAGLLAGWGLVAAGGGLFERWKR
ncbi:hypothetical protein ACFWTE_28690 [Nocardiopsis sp. NPDC058631]|uniref:hypothetical protein n=1 Tax=Nocardiopsis sp. NPDC058631 TaxID=3346566 RepID=UPI0036547C75